MHHDPLARNLLESQRFLQPFQPVTTHRTDGSPWPRYGMGIPKKGKHSVGVARQWCGATGKIDNCQVVVNLTLTRPGEQKNKDQVTWPLGSQLYLTKQWAGVENAYDDARQTAFFQERREATGVPEDVAFRSKPEIGLGLVRRALDAGIEHRCTNADAGFGRDGGFRKQLRDWEEPYVCWGGSSHRRSGG